MHKIDPLPSETEAFDAVVRAYRANKVIFFTDPKVLNRPGSPVYNALDVFVPPLVLMASSLTLLFAFGMIEWMLGLVIVLIYQLLLAPRLVVWRMHQRTVQALLRNLHNFRVLWQKGGIAVALKDFPEKNCIAPSGNWREFTAEWLMGEENAETSSSTALTAGQ